MAGMKSKVSSLSVLKDIFSDVLPSEIIYMISKFHGRWVKLTVPTSIKIKIRQPRNKRCRKKHVISHHYV